jgi:hypothetical protein
MRVALFLLIPIAFLASCMGVKSSFFPDSNIVMESKKNKDSVEFLLNKPFRKAFRIGIITVSGNGYADFDDLVNDAKEKAANLGADFILVEKSGVEKSTVVSPGYSTFRADTNANYSQSYGYANSGAAGYSVGPSITEINKPWSHFSVWVYSPYRLGVVFDNEGKIQEFSLNCDAEEAGAKIGDKLLGINGHDISDVQDISHLMTIKPGDKVTLAVQRNGKKLEYRVTALPN